MSMFIINNDYWSETPLAQNLLYPTKVCPMDWRAYIEQNPQIMYGKAVLKGTRIPVDLIIEKLSLGETLESILEAYPTLARHHILSCLAYATAMIRNEDVYLLTS